MLPLLPSNAIDPNIETTFKRNLRKLDGILEKMVIDHREQHPFVHKCLQKYKLYMIIYKNMVTYPGRKYMASPTNSSK